MRALVIGGGIAGLSAARALQCAGIAATVYERTGELREVGAGLTLWTNAVKAARELALGEEIEAVGWPLVRGELRDWRGKVLVATAVDELGREHGAPSLAIHRADLQQILLSALDSGSVCLGARFTGYEQDESGVIACFEDGSRERGDMLVGADGINSTVRRQLLGPEKLRYAGYTGWRGVAERPVDLAPPGVTFESWGRGARFGSIRIDADRVYWYATANVPPGSRDGALGRKRELLARFDGWHAPVAELIGATPESAILRNDVFDRAPSDRWGEHRVTLVGDAAHPMTPNLGQGACQAMEDAVVLARCLRAESDPAAALRTYQARRIRRTASIVRQARQAGVMGQWEHPLARAVRDRILPYTETLMRRQLQAIMSYEL